MPVSRDCGRRLGGHGALEDPVVGLVQLPDLSPTERLNLIKDTWATVLTENDAWRISLTEYLYLAAGLAKLDGKDGGVYKNVWVWAILIQPSAC